MVVGDGVVVGVCKTGKRRWKRNIEKKRNRVRREKGQGRGGCDVCAEGEKG